MSFVFPILINKVAHIFTFSLICPRLLDKFLYNLIFLHGLKLITNKIFKIFCNINITTTHKQEKTFLIKNLVSTI